MSKESHEQGSRVLAGLGLQEATGEQRCHSSAGVGLKLECSGRGIPWIEQDRDYSE